MIYINAGQLSELIGGRTEEFCNRARVSKQVCYRLFHHGGPVLMATLTKVAKTLGVTPISLIDLRRTPSHSLRQLAVE